MDLRGPAAAALVGATVATAQWWTMKHPTPPNVALSAVAITAPAVVGAILAQSSGAYEALGTGLFDGWVAVTAQAITQLAVMPVAGGHREAAPVAGMPWVAVRRQAA